MFIIYHHTTKLYIIRCNSIRKENYLYFFENNAQINCLHETMCAFIYFLINNYQEIGG